MSGQDLLKLRAILKIVKMAKESTIMERAALNRISKVIETDEADLSGLEKLSEEPRPPSNYSMPDLSGGCTGGIFKAAA